MDGLREQQKRRTRTALRQAALDRFERDGFDATTVDDIAADVGVSPRTFFRYFPGKDDVVLGPYRTTFDRWEASVSRAPGGETVIDALAAASRVVEEAYAADPAFWDRFQRLVSSDPGLMPRMLRLQAELQARAAAVLAERLGLAPSDLRPRMVAAAAMAGVGAAVAGWYANGRRGSRADAVADAYRELADLTAVLTTRLPDRSP